MNRTNDDEANIQGEYIHGGYTTRDEFLRLNEKRTIENQNIVPTEYDPMVKSIRDVLKRNPDALSKGEQ